MRRETTAEFKCANADHAGRKAVMYCSRCKAYFCEECEKSVHNNMFSHHTKYVTRDFLHASPVPQKPEECPAHSSELNLFCPTHYVLCCSKCNLGKDGAHKGCPVVPFDEEDSLKAVHNNLEADTAALREKAEIMVGPTVAALSKKQDEVEENVAAVRAEIEALFNKIRDALNAREKALLREVEGISEGLIYG